MSSDVADEFRTWGSGGEVLENSRGVEAFH